ncbi:MAG TPA: efflux RND transporter periplasmic adaptor subunit [Gemmataceae bacterium]|nr:efflux RND transporter periplasmic adaptor subunit [Gemmataceae bacterium]
MTIAKPAWLRAFRKAATTLLALVGLVLFLAWMGGAFHAKVAPGLVQPEQPSAVGRELVPVKLSPVKETIVAVASVQPRRKADIAGQIIAGVREVHVQPGDRVKPGDLLIELDDRELLAQQREALAAVRAAEVDLEVRKKDYDRIMSLSEAQTSKEERDRLTGYYHTAQAQLKRSQEQGSRIEVMLTYTKIKATGEGVVADRFVDPGDLAVPGKPLLNVQDTRELELHASVPESQATHVLVNQELALRIDAANITTTGRVREIVPVAQQQSRSVLIKVTLPTALSGTVYAGMFGRVTIPIGEGERLLLPAAAIQHVGQLELVDVETPDHKLERRFVRVGRSFNGEVEILSGVNRGDKVALRK